jgi:tRNA U34 5-methylaminomethyl-2-thiouridine-forming methyltransferase MnmC
MTPNDQITALEWRSGTVPISTRFDDPYFSLDSGLAETQHVFLAGNSLPQRLRAGFSIAELGFGTGLNLIATAMICPPTVPIFYTSFEAYPLQSADMARALAHFPSTDVWAAPFLRAWEGAAGAIRSFDLGPISVKVIIGDARGTLPNWAGAADAWYLDGFSPAKNPQLWSPEILQQVVRHTAPMGTFATYTAAGHVRRALADAGFSVTRSAGFGRKRHMSMGVLA